MSKRKLRRKSFIFQCEEDSKDHSLNTKKASSFFFIKLQTWKGWDLVSYFFPTSEQLYQQGSKLQTKLSLLFFSDKKPFVICYLQLILLEIAMLFVFPSMLATSKPWNCWMHVPDISEYLTPSPPHGIITDPSRQISLKRHR